MKIAIVNFLGSMEVLDVKNAIQQVAENVDVEIIDHQVTDLSDYHGVILPGGASYGDSIAPGAGAAQTPIIQALKDFAAQGKSVLGLGNGFQILVFSQLLPGGFLLNQKRRALNGIVPVKIEHTHSSVTHLFYPGEILELPIAHKYGQYFVDDETLIQMQDNQDILLTYQNNLNGSTADIAGIKNQNGNVIGLMVKPERAMDAALGSDDGKGFFASWIQYLSVKKEDEK